ncbi:hypothetical protein GE21DRAFT_6574 [Neurospora crassa]|uniref:Uncharacterized protein n=1 Tax=Neurospora crassa (strain ATCC 24698 / 74-OR23-1A / CBS 708.71 / DSM 1257 / FGSC 987) TaxID=367110 RepID=Q7S8F6_NEUCR|nr:hypothetical protein NCU08814 [Neurospora crassa OR74A]EAA32618.2 hypothetical protein NCU08814 [Neurospora crassa OR74A]KHE78790.1 hypothetical protein GE21DRAFT_6574 [Neurospora crassa]|eukprot:XP_961854.2 hypothetical protein NCU08814 [Neurospora crassa OR74A]
MSSPPDLPPPKAQDTEPGVLSPTPSASQPRHDVPKRLIDMCIEPRKILFNLKFTPPFDAVEVGRTIQFGCYPKRELKEPGLEDGGRNSPIQTTNRALDLVRSPDAMHWYIFANSNVVWDITTEPVSHREYHTSGSEVMPFGPASSAARTSDYQEPLVPRYATAVPESPPDPTNDPYARVWRKPAVREMVEPWKDKVAQTAENVDPDEIPPSPPSVYLKSSFSSRRSSTVEVPASNSGYVKANTEIKQLSQITVEEKELDTEDVETQSQSGDEDMRIDADNASNSGGSPMDLDEKLS